jgi:hypothetical protein
VKCVVLNKNFVNKLNKSFLYKVTMIVDTLYKGTSIIKGNEQSKQEKVIEKNIIETIENKKINYLNLSQGFKDAYDTRKKLLKK